MHQLKKKKKKNSSFQPRPGKMYSRIMNNQTCNVIRFSKSSCDNHTCSLTFPSNRLIALTHFFKSLFSFFPSFFFFYIPRSFSPPLFLFDSSFSSRVSRRKILTIYTRFRNYEISIPENTGIVSMVSIFNDIKLHFRILNPFVGINFHIEGKLFGK